MSLPLSSPAPSVGLLIGSVSRDYSTASKEKQRIEQDQRDKAEDRKKKGETCVAAPSFRHSFRLPPPPPKLTSCRRPPRSYRPVFFEPEPDDLSEWDGRPRLTEAGRAALERDFKADYSGGGSVGKIE